MQKLSSLLTAILFCFAVACLAVGFVVLRDRDFSESENRALAQTPEFNSDKLFSGRFATDMNEYYADQFPMRDTFVALKSLSETAMLKNENNGVMLGRDGYLAVRLFDAYKSRLVRTADTDYFYESNILSQINALNSLGNSLEVPLVTVIPPRTVDVAKDNFDYVSPTGDRLYELLSDNLGAKTGYTELLPLMRNAHNSGEYVYYRTDHHWTANGAYYAYREIMKSLGRGEKIIPADRFEKEEIPDFYGTTAARASFPFIRGDTLGIWTLPDGDEYTVTVDGKELQGFFERSHLETRDKYSVFLDGTHAITEISSGKDRDKLLIVKDSFANSIIPLLAREFDIVALNLSAGSTDITSLAEYYQADAVLIVCNAENMITTGTLGNVK